MEWTPILKAALSFGIWDRPWRHVKYTDFPSVGRFESKFFQPQLWRPEYPNPAFERMLPGDAFWAVRIIMRFSDEMIRALVRTGQYSDERAEEYLVETIIKRKDKIVRHYLVQINSLDEFSVTQQDGSHRLLFRNLAAEVGLAPAGPYQYQWFRYSNQNGSLQPVEASVLGGQESLPVTQDNAKFLMIRITPEEQPGIDLYLWNRETGHKVVGIERRSH
jgi:hypothetical protein